MLGHIAAVFSVVPTIPAHMAHIRAAIQTASAAPTSATVLLYPSVRQMLQRLIDAFTESNTAGQTEMLVYSETIAALYPPDGATCNVYNVSLAAPEEITQLFKGIVSARQSQVAAKAATETKPKSKSKVRVLGEVSNGP